MRTPSAKAQPAPSLRGVINATKKLWRQYHLSYDQTRDVSKEVRRALAIERTKMRQRVIARLSREEETRLITHAYQRQGERGLFIKTLFQTGARVSEFVNLKAEDVFFDEQMILMAKAKGGKSRYVPIVPRATHPRRIQQIRKETAEQAQITKRVYPHLLRYSVATTLRERGMPIEQIQKFLGHSKRETTQLYAESSTAMMRESSQRALAR